MKVNLNQLFDYLKGKSILILGFGREGKSSLAFIKRHDKKLALKQLGIADAKGIELESSEGIRLHIGEHYLDAMSEYELVLKSPGISFREFHRSKLGANRLLEYPNCEISSQIDLVLRFMPDLYTIGISGTKGKSTTTSLLFNIMQQTSRPSYLRGNIGTPVFDDIENYEAGAVLCLELSSHQLEFVQASVNSAALSNFFPEHLDHYRNYNEYLQAKLNILRFQNQDNLFVLNTDDSELLKLSLPLINAQVILIGNGLKPNEEAYQRLALHTRILAHVILFDHGFEYINLESERRHFFHVTQLNPHLLGRHHIFDAAIASSSAFLAGADYKSIEEGIKTFKGLPHRNEWVRTVKGVSYYNDSIATIPQSTILALETLPKVSCLLIGGMDRGLDYSDFMAQLLSMTHLNLICLPDTGKQFYDYFVEKGSTHRVFQVESIEEAVHLSSTLATEGSSVLLSPAASSYHRFENFEERGKAFKDAVLSLKD